MHGLGLVQCRKHEYTPGQACGKKLLWALECGKILGCDRSDEDRLGDQMNYDRERNFVLSKTEKKILLLYEEVDS
jgi:hypothetical protein